MCIEMGASPHNPYITHNRLYRASVLYRELKLRSAIMDGAQLRTLPQEQIYSTVAGIWNLSSDQGNLGTFVVTNVRLVWFADVNGSFNISLPYIQMAAVRISILSTTPTGDCICIRSHAVDSLARLQIRSGTGHPNVVHCRQLCARLPHRSARSSA